MKIEEEIDVPEFGWYEMNIEEDDSGVPVSITVSSAKPYLDSLGPRIRINPTLSRNPADMIPVFVDNSIVPDGVVPSETVEKIMMFINANKATLIRHWNDTYGNSYTSHDLYEDLVKI